MNKILKLIKEARFVFVCGNGGSAATAEHLVVDLMKKGKPAICLNSNASLITMIANDFGYQYIFAKQLETLANGEDLLITISCSGTSANIVYAQELANDMGMEVYPFETFKKRKNYGDLEDKHLAFAHEIARNI